MMARCILVLAWLAPALLAQETGRSFPPVTRQEVWQAVAGELRDRGLREEQLPRAEDLDLPVAVPASQGRTLRVAAVCWDADRGRVEFRLECREAVQCIPFLAYVPSIDVRTAERAHAGSCRSGPGSAPAQPKKVAVRAGERAMVVLVANRLRLTTSVICLERGTEGEIIRVKNQDGHIFRARVRAPAVLEALPQ
ncbi:MAG: flagella basal body P-ring formation protein FlgA [Acidobacteriia bacterium]|nr:flagella basal body P-ring formation protein FlgA [Terriglobia bacterium]